MDEPRPVRPPSAWSLRGILPVLSWLPHYRRAWIRTDLLAGLTLAAYLIPAGIGDASLAGLPPEAGLYACLCAGLVFWLFCSSRHTSITVTSAISLLVGASLEPIAGGDVSRFGALAAATALLVAILSVLAWAVRGGALVNFVSETVMVGFKAGVALFLASTQLPKLIGLPGAHGSFWERMGFLFSHIREAHPTAVILGLAALAAVLAGKRYLSKRPVALFVVIAGILVARLGRLGDAGVKLLGPVPQGAPPLTWPAIGWGDVNELFTLAMACFLLAAVESAAIGRMFSSKHGYRFDTNQDFLALGGANLASALGGGFPVSGGMSQSLVNEGAGARTPLSGFVAALFVLLTALFLSGWLESLPQPVLAAIVLGAVTSLFRPAEFRRLWRFSRAEFLVAIAAVFGVLGSGLLRGVLVGAILSILVLLRRGSRPNTTELGRVGDSHFFADRIRHPENPRVPGVFVFRVQGALLYFNVEHIRERFLELLETRDPDTRLVVFFLGAVPGADLAGSEFLAEVHHLVREMGMELRLAEARGEVREALRRSGYEKEFGEVFANQPVDEVIRAWQAE